MSTKISILGLAAAVFAMLLMGACSMGPRCQDNIDCIGGYACVSGKCLKVPVCGQDKACPPNQTTPPPQQLTCQPGTRLCKGNALQICQTSGARWDTLDCGTHHTCEKGNCVRKAISNDCGNGTIESPEQCDDGNQLSGDGCSRYCLKEQVMRKEPPASENTIMPAILGSWRCRNADLRKKSLANQTLLKVKVTVTICRINGRPVVSNAVIGQHIARMNQVFGPAKLSFVLGATLWEDNAGRCEVFYNTESTATLNRYTKADAVSIFYARNISGGSFAVGGFANLSGIVLNATSGGLADVLAHEMGHTFGLDHPHACNYGRESSANCSQAGDQLCDTPNDPGPRGINGLDVCQDGRQKNGQCTVQGCRIVNCPGGQKPLINNLMSYYDCGVALTNDQLATLRCVALHDQVKRTSSTATTPPTCTADRKWAATDTACCSKQRDDRGNCCIGNNCCAPRNNSYTSSTGGCQCRAGYKWVSTNNTNDKRCSLPSTNPPPTCTGDGQSAVSDTACCSKKRDDRGKCCVGNNCCAPRNNSYTSSTGGCQCRAGYKWVSANNTNDKRCKLPSTNPPPPPPCHNDGQKSPRPADCCSKQRSDQGVCCTGKACCGIENNSWTVSSGKCQCRPGFVPTTPGDSSDKSCKKEGTTPPPPPPPPTQFGCTPKFALQGHSAQINAVAVSPNGQYVASGSSDKTIRLYNAVSGSLLKTLKGHTGAVLSLHFSPNSGELASGGSDHTYRRWNVGTGLQIKEHRAPAPVHGLAFHPKGAGAITGSEKNAMVWDTNGTGHHFAGGAFVRSLAIHPGGGLVALARNNKSISIYNTQTKALQRTINGHTSYPLGIDYSANGALLASSSTKVRIWDTSTGRQLHEIAAHTGVTFDVAFHPTKEILYTGGQDGLLKVWAGKTYQLVQTLSGHTGAVHSISTSANGVTLASGAKDKVLRIWKCQ